MASVNYAFLFLFLQSPKTHTDDTGETFDETGLHKFAKIIIIKV